MNDHGDHVFIAAVKVLGDQRPLWAFQCRSCDAYGVIRFEYRAAVNDGHSHVEEVADGRA